MPSFTTASAAHLAALALVFYALVVAVVAPSTRVPREPSGTRANVLLISIDSLRSDHLHAYGYRRETSPVMDGIGRAGVRFDTMVSASSWTLPAHVTLLTAQPPVQHEVSSVRTRLSEEVVTLAEVLEAQGYDTAAFVSGPFLRPIYGYDQGFDVYDESVVGRGKNAHVGLTSPRLLRLTEDWLSAWKNRTPRQPFFVFLHMWDPHYDYAPPAPYDTMFDPDYDGDMDGSRFAKNPGVHAGMDPRDLEHIVALYDGEIRYTDEHIGRLLDTLREIGVYDETLVVVTSDHGEEFFEHGQKGHAKTLYEEIVRIPLLLQYPERVPPGQVIEEQVRLMDVAPTILGLARVPRPAGFGTGSRDEHRERDLSPWLAGGAPREAFPRLYGFSSSSLMGKQVAVRSPDTKLILYENRKGNRRREVFDLEVDSAETRNLSPVGPLPDAARRLKDEADGWVAEMSPRQAAVDRMELDRKQVESLRALGYVE